MIKKRRNLFIMLVVIVLVLSATVGAIVASSNETRFNNTILASSVAAVSSSGLLTVTNQYQGISGTTKGEITTYIEKKTWGLFWKRVYIGEPNNEWDDVIYNYVYAGDHTFQLPSKGTYRITVVYVISGSGGAADTITQTMTKTY